MSNKQQITMELEKVEEAIAAQEALRGILAEAQIEAALAPLRQKRAALTAQLNEEGSGVSAPGGAGGIHAGRIKADNVVQGMQQLGGNLENAAGALAVAEALRSGSITADSIAARNVVAGLQYIADPAAATPDQLRQEVARLRQELSEALAAGEVEANADVEDAQEALAKAETELEQDAPQGSRVVRKLKEAADILTEGARTTDAARKAGIALIKLAPVAAALYQIAVKVFGG